MKPPQDIITDIKYFKNSRGVYSFEEKDISLSFFDCDTPEVFSQQKKLKNLSYGPNDITYDFNSEGHRCSSLDSISDNYILYTGCSNTFGTGLPLKETYSYLTSKHFNTRYYNIALRASGNDLIFYNLSLFLKNVTTLPSLIIIQPTFLERFYIEYKNYLKVIGHWNFESLPPSSLRNYVNYISDPMFKFNVFNNLKNNTLNYLNILNIPSILISSDWYEGEEVRLNLLDKARDANHPGVESNKDLSQQLINYISSNPKYLNSIK